MKKALFSLVMALALLSFVNPSWAGKVMGDVVKVEGDFVYVKDSSGKEHKFHTDNTTKKMGDVKAGAHVEVDEDAGHAKSIKVMEMMK